MKDTLQAAINSVIGRVVAGVTVTLLLPLMPAITNALNSIVGLGLTDAEVMDFAKAAAVGAALTVATWLYNRGRWESTALALKDAYDRGAKATHIEGGDAVVEREPQGPRGL